jgi:hypothetical protein
MILYDEMVVLSTLTTNASAELISTTFNQNP